MPEFDSGLTDGIARIRLGLGDTGPRFDLADETIEALLEAYAGAANPALSAAIAGARALSAKYLKKAQSERQGDLSRSYFDRSKGYADLAVALGRDGLPGDPSPPPSATVASSSGVVALPGSDRENGAYPFPR